MSDFNQDYSFEDSESEVQVFSHHVPRFVCKEFIAAYRKLPILWDPSHNFYNSKYWRAKAYEELIPILQQSLPTANQVTVRRQINVLRTNYRKVHQKFLRSQTTVDGKNIFTFQPKNWRYHEMKFLDSVANFGCDNISKGTKENADESDPDDDPPTENVRCELPRIKHYKSSRPKTKVMKDEDYHDVMEILDEAANEEFKCIGRNVASKLKRMNVDQRYHAELLINKILINALRSKLNDATDVVGLPTLDEPVLNTSQFKDETDTDFDDNDFQESLAF